MRSRGDLLGESQHTITSWADATFGKPATNASIVERARKELDELAAALAEDDDHPKSVEECADIVIVLSRLVERRGGDLLAEVDRKMAINRGRKWTLDGNGHGQHVKESFGHAIACPKCGAAPGVHCKLTVAEYVSAGEPTCGANGQHGVVHEERSEAAF